MEKKILALFSKKSSLEIHGCRLQSVGGKRWQWQSIYPAFIHSFKNYLVSMCYSLGWVGHIKMNNTKLYSLQTCSLDGRIVISSWTSWSLKSPHSARFFRWKSISLSLLWEVFWKPDTVSLPYALSVRPRQGTWQKWGDFPWPLLIVLTELTLTGGPSYRGSLEAWESSQGQLVGVPLPGSSFASSKLLRDWPAVLPSTHPWNPLAGSLGLPRAPPWDPDSGPW